MRRDGTRTPFRRYFVTVAIMRLAVQAVDRVQVAVLVAVRSRLPEFSIINPVRVAKATWTISATASSTPPGDADDLLPGGRTNFVAELGIVNGSRDHHGTHARGHKRQGLLARVGGV